MSGTLDEMVTRLKAQTDELRGRGIEHLSIFGSIARGEDRPDSDVDIAVDIAPGRSFSLIRLEDTRLMLEGVLGRRVDLGETISFRPMVRATYDQAHVRVF